MPRNSKLSVAHALVAFALTFGATTSAFAAPTTVGPVTVTQVGFNVIATQLVIHTSDGSAYVVNTGNLCDLVSPPVPPIAPTFEVVKIWVSLAQSALLSGKKVLITYDNCNGYRWLENLEIVQ
jgi:hypothetical protein